MSAHTQPAGPVPPTGSAGPGPAVWAALATVRDPELDQPITELGFVDEWHVDETGVRVRLRLPTYFCAPNFAYLMVADAYDAITAVPGVGSVDVRLNDHFAAEEINAGIAAGRGFAEAFPGLATGELEQLRLAFLRKAHLAAQDRLCRTLQRAGRSPEQLAELRLGDVPTSPERDRLRRHRQRLGMPARLEDPLLVDDTGHPVPAADAAAHLLRARAVRVSVDGNAEWCRGLLTTRYGDRTADQSTQHIRERT